MTVRRSSGVVVIVFIAGGLVGYGLRGRLGPSRDAEEAAPHETAESEDELVVETLDPADLAVPVQLGTATRGEFARTLAAVARVDAAQDAVRTVSSRASGIIAEVAVVAPIAVKTGDLLLRFLGEPRAEELAKTEADRSAARLARAEFERVGRTRSEAELNAALGSAQSKLALAEAEVTRVRPLVERGELAARILLEATTAVEDAKRGVQLAQLALSAFGSGGADAVLSSLSHAEAVANAAFDDLTARLAALEVRAEFDGWLSDLPWRVGDRAEPGAPLGSLRSSERRVAYLALSPSAAAVVKQAMRVRFDHRGEEIQGVIEALRDDLATTGVVVARVALDAGIANAPLVGEVLAAEIEIERLVDALIVPAAAIVHAEDHDLVFTVDANHVAHAVEVEVVSRHGDRAAVRGEIEPGSEVIVDGAFALPDGAHVVAKE